MTREVKIGNLRVGGRRPLFLVAGPCVIESEAHAFRHAEKIKAIAQSVGIPFIFKASYDKANRLSHTSYRGPGLEKGLAILARIKRELSLPILSDVHCVEEVEPAAKVLDVLQVPAFLSRQTDLVTALAKTGKPVNLKKGQFLAPWDMKNIIQKVEATGNRNILVTERGASFGYNTLVSDLRSLPILESYGYPVVYDGTHSVQQPGGLGTASGGQREFVPGLVRAAAAMGCDGIFLEVHEDPDTAPSDGPNMLRLADLEGLLRQVIVIDRVVRERETVGEAIGKASLTD